MTPRITQNTRFDAFLLLLLTMNVLFEQGAGITTTTTNDDSNQQCFPEVLNSSDLLLKRVWTVGVLAIRGPDAAIDEFNTTFSTYLSSTAGRRFDPPIQFEMKPLNFLNLFTDSEAGLVDFIYVNPSAFSCIESEYGARSLASQISRRVISGDKHFLKRFGGVITTRADRDDINTIHDLKDKVIAAASISGLGSGQMQFREMQDNGMSYINDPKQLVFTSNQGKVVKGVLNGDFDVGFVRTDQLERSKDSDGNPIDTSLFKVIDPKPSLHIDRQPFPFDSSTPLYPEWNIAALEHVPDVISQEVQVAMLAIGKHAQASSLQQQCIEEALAGDKNKNLTQYMNLDEVCPFTPKLCDSTDEIANIALKASNAGKYSEWVPSLSYMELRSMQEATGFIARNEETNTWRCLRSAEIYDSISCPADGWMKKSKDEVDNGCTEAGLECQDGYQCICSPCYKPFTCIDSVDIGGNCVPYTVFLPAILVPIAVLFLTGCFGMLWYKSNQMVNQAEISAKNERDLNEFIAHEVRNPLSAALSASVFVNTAVQADVNEDTLDSLREDANIISSSLRFINDLLRSMLDVNRATRDQMVLEQDSVDVLHDIFEPTASMIYARDTNFTVQIDCPEGLVVKSDKLRLQQVVLNLARNSAKFVEEGFVRLRAEVIENSVHLFIEDSGPGIPEEKRNSLFNKYQKSLDSLAQGTGVGLSLVLKLVSLMDGTIWLDEAYESGFNGHPGARLVIDLKQPPGIDEHSDELDCISKIFDFDISTRSHKLNLDELDEELPRHMSVLFVDDDRNLRKLARRALLQLRPHWDIREAASGEAAMKLCEKETFDLIFIDQYMTSVEQCLKGTETVRALRARGITKSVICGLSANNLHTVFEGAGADHFITKPFPSDPNGVFKLLKLLLSKRMLADTSEKTTGSSVAVTEMTGEASNVSLEDIPEERTSTDSKRSISGIATGSNISSSAVTDPSTSTSSSSSEQRQDLPKTLSVLFVDDDRVLRRLAMRSLKTLIPDCHVRETCSGESALLLCETDTFDIIFMDMYMTSTATDSMTGIETVTALRSKGITSLICGLSANHQGKEFFNAGADHFILKPFPCKESDLRPELIDILSKREHGQDEMVDFTVDLMDVV